VVIVGADLPTVLLDETATPEQVLALLDALNGRGRTPPAGIAGTAADGQRHVLVPVRSHFSRRSVVVSIPHRLRIAARLGAPVGAAAADIEVTLPEHNLEWQGRRVPVRTWTFPSSWRHRDPKTAAGNPAHAPGAGEE
jgi:hypothetical protein